MLKGRNMAQWINLSEQQIRESEDHTLIVWKNWSPSTSGTRSYVSQAGRPSDSRSLTPAGILHKLFGIPSVIWNLRQMKS